MGKHKRHWTSRQGGGSSSSQAASTCVIIFSKAPIPGEVKTRLCPPLTPDEAASLHGSMVLDLIERTKRCQGVHRLLACSPSLDHPFFTTVGSRHGFQLLNQTGEDLGSRMHHAIQTSFSQGFQNVILIGTDIPSLQSSIVKAAQDQLVDHDVVLGPTYDGGYYLIGLQHPQAELFTDLPWSTNQVCSLTRSKARTLGLSVGELQTEQDLDTLDDLQHHIQVLDGPQSSLISLRTQGVLRTLQGRLSSRGPVHSSPE